LFETDRFYERIALLAVLMSLVALSIDAVLPALGSIGSELAVESDNGAQYVIGAFLLGLSFGQLFYGPISDSTGRRLPIQAGLIIFMIGSVVSLFAQSFEAMIAGRILQGIGVAGPRVVTVALVRDDYAGAEMARVMSIIMAVFIIVPALAPMLGQAILILAHWRAIFGAFLLLSIITLLWFSLRQRETHPITKRQAFSIVRIVNAMGECLIHPVSRNYALAAGVMFGSFVGFLTSAQQIFHETYDVIAWFPAYFAILALSIGAATFTNSRLVVRFGMQRLSRWALTGLTCMALAGLALCSFTGGAPPLWALMMSLMPCFFCFGILFGNFNALSMEPMGHIAGSASAIIASLTSLIAVSIGTTIGQSFDGTVIPLFVGFLLTALVATGLSAYTERWRLRATKDAVGD